MHPAVWKRKENTLRNVNPLFWIKGWAKASGTLSKSRVPWTQNTGSSYSKENYTIVEHLVKPEI